MAQQIIAALDLGTSKSVAFVAKRDYLNRLSVMRTETIPVEIAIRRGRIFNPDETSEIISRLIRKLNNNPDVLIEKMYVGIGGQSLRSQSFNVKKVVTSGTITKQLLDSIEDEAKNYETGVDENLGIASCEYYADGQSVSTPKGTVASLIEARFQLIVGNPCLKRNLERVFAGKDISVAEYFISPVATAEAVLTPAEKQAGCALIEFGEGVTYISIYKNKTLKYLATLPLGGIAITNDIKICLNITEEAEAEALKINHGKAASESNDSGSVPVNEASNSSREIELKELNCIITARVNEIVYNVWSLIETSGYSQALDAGIVITGGGALLRDLPQFIQNLTGKEVRLAKATVWDNQQEIQLSPVNSCVVGLAILGKDNCGTEKEKVTKVKEREKETMPYVFSDEELKKLEKEKKEKEKEGNQSDLQGGKGNINIIDKVKIFIEKGKSLFDEENSPNGTQAKKSAANGNIDFENDINKQ